MQHPSPTFITLDLNAPPISWVHSLWDDALGDFILCDPSPDRITWFSTMFAAAMTEAGSVEVAHVYGKYARSLSAVIYHLNKSLPASYVLGKSHHALYDLLLNFETEPKRRLLIWHDASVMLAQKPLLFTEIVESMVTAAYLNRNGLSTYKENGTAYRVDQRNLFLFPKHSLDEVSLIVDHTYTVNSIMYEEPLETKLPFTIVSLQ